MMVQFYVHTTSDGRHTVEADNYKDARRKVRARLNIQTPLGLLGFIWPCEKVIKGKPGKRPFYE